MHRVEGRDSFRRLARSAQRSRVRGLSVARVDPPRGDPDRRAFAFAISRGHGTAVVRNRLRRRLRAAIRELIGRGAVTPGSYLISPRRDASLDRRPFDQLVADLGEAMRRFGAEPASAHASAHD